MTFGCASAKPTLENDARVTFRQQEALLERFGGLQSPAESQYFHGICNRLLALPTEIKGPRTLSILILATPQPLAVSPGLGVVALSKGLILSLQSESELAFVIAHELAHQQLGHLSRVEEAKDPAIQQTFEREADLRGVGILAHAGYDPRVAEHALVHVHEALDPTLSNIAPAPNYPSLEERVLALRQAIADSGWQPPGTIDRRDFHALKSWLNQQ